MDSRSVLLRLTFHKQAPQFQAKKAAKPKGEKKPKTAPSHPTYSSMISKAIAELKERGGSSRSAILKYILAHYKLGNNHTQVRYLGSFRNKQ